MFRVLAQLFGWSSSRQSEQHELFVHEDDWSQIELLPAAVAAWCTDEMRRIGVFAEQQRVSGGHGWSDIYVRADPPTTLAHMHLDFSGACTALHARLPRFSVVTSGTFSSPQPVPRVAAFGPARHAGIVLVPDNGGALVAGATLILHGTAGDNAAVLAAAATLPSEAALIVADWMRGRIVDASDRTAIERYLQG